MKVIESIWAFLCAVAALIWWSVTWTKQDTLAALIEEYGEDEGIERFNSGRS